MNRFKKIFFIILFFSPLLWRGAGGEAFSQTAPLKVIFLHTRPAPQTITIPLTPAQAHGKKIILHWGKDTIERTKEIPLKPLETKPALPPISNFTNFNTEQGLALSSIACGFKDKSGNLWFGTYGGGASRYDGKSFTTFTTAQGLAHNVVLSITEDKSGNLWFGTEGGGASRYDGKSFTTFTTAQGLAHNVVLSITEDKSGNLWFGTAGGGASRYDGKSFTNFTTAQGLANDVVYGILEDNQGTLWVGTNLGFSGLKFQTRLTPRPSPQGEGSKSPPYQRGIKGDVIPADNNLSNEEIKKLKPVWEIYNNSTGYPVKDINANNGNGSWCITKIGFNGDKENVGIIWAGTGDDKLLRFEPKAVNKNTEPPAVFIQAVKVNEENICWYNLEIPRSARNDNGSEGGAGAGGLKPARSSSSPGDTVIPNGAKRSEESPNDSAAIAHQEIMTYGKLLSDEVRDSITKKFSDIQFDGITKWYPLPENLVLPYNHNNVTFDFIAIETGRNFLVRYQYCLTPGSSPKERGDLDKLEWSPITEKTSATFNNLWEGTYTFVLRARSPEGIWSNPLAPLPSGGVGGGLFTFKVLPPWWRTWYMYSLYGLMAILVVWLIVWWNGRRLRARAKELTEEVRKATVTIVEQKKIVEEKNKDITDSITYAKRIQQAKLPDKKEIQKALPNSFVLFKPKDIVSGDFYYFHKSTAPSNSPEGGELARGIPPSGGGGALFLAAADCTGHGVPGAFMSMIGSEKLDDALAHSTDTSEILAHLNKGIKNSLHQSDSDESTRDGMDIALCSVEFPSPSERDGMVRLKYAGANRPFWLINPDRKEWPPQAIPFGEGLGGAEIKPTKKAIGGFTEDSQHFDTHEIKLQRGDTFYIFTDGYADQDGGEKGKKIMTKKFKEILLGIQDKTIQEQEKFLYDFIENWRGNREQVDDILVIGIRI